MKQLINYFRGAWQELEKVTWPTRNQAIRSATIVIIFTLAAGVFLTLIDYGLTEAVSWMIFNFR